MDEIRVALIQSDLHWHRAEANLASMEERIWKIKEPVDLIILPEMFNTGFSMEAARLAEPVNGKTFRWMKQMAGQTRAVVTGSLIIGENGNYYNRLIWMQPDGSFHYYDKRHLFRMAREHLTYTAGNKQLITELDSWRICPLICYDLRFPVWSRNRYMEEEKRMAYDLVIYIANWPAARIQAWDSLLRARAIENGCYSIGVNRVGKDGNGILYNGHTAAFDPTGKKMITLKQESGMKTIKLSLKTLQRYREKFPFYLDNDHFELN